jgi:hypothetical protein
MTVLYAVGMYFVFALSGAVVSLPEFSRDMTFLLGNLEHLRDDRYRNVLRRAKKQDGASLLAATAGAFMVFALRWTFTPWRQVGHWWRGERLLSAARVVAARRMMTEVGSALDENFLERAEQEARKQREAMNDLVNRLGSRPDEQLVENTTVGGKPLREKIEDFADFCGRDDEYLSRVRAAAGVSDFSKLQVGEVETILDLILSDHHLRQKENG